MDPERRHANLARFWQAGAWGTVEDPALEAGTAWPVFHTGLLPGHQPQYDARRLFDARDYSIRWYGAEETAPTLWRKLSDQGLRCLLIDPPYVPLDPQINGSMILDWGGHMPANGPVPDSPRVGHLPGFKTHIMQGREEKAHVREL